MGTSKGYIAPTTQHWSTAKRNVSKYVSEPTTSNLQQSINRYAKAIKTDADFGRISSAFSNALTFITNVKSHGYESALNTIGRNDIINMTTGEAINELFYYFSNENQTIDDNIALDCLSVAFEALDITDLEKVDEIDIHHVLKELICQFAERKFAQMFDKQIRNKCKNPIEANNRIAEMQEYIYYTLEEKLTYAKIIEINPRNLTDEAVVSDTLVEAFTLLEKYYEED